jgi:ABC-type multidrug transport system ATPase subunit
MSVLALRFENVQVHRQGACVLDVPGLSIGKNQTTAVVGDNGAGKTTLLLAAAGLVNLSRGNIKLFGKPFHQGQAPASKSQRQLIGIAFQDLYMFAKSVRHNIELGLKIRGMSKSLCRKKSSAIMEGLGLQDLAKRRAQELSGGERKLVSLARAMVQEPELLLLDEVFESLDDKAAGRVEIAINQFVAEKKATVLMTVHRADPVWRLTSKRIELSAGRLM